MKNLFIILLLSITFISCVDNDVIRALSEAESNMQGNPELSLKLLESIDRDELKTRKHTARHALLYSMALDKNYIDISSDSIIAPAVRYYRRHGDINLRFSCNYYEARIRENSGDIKNALLCISKAEKMDTSKVDDGLLCMLYAMKGSIYDQAWRAADAVKAKEMARKYALRSGKLYHYVYYTLSCAISYRKLEEKGNLDKCISDAEKYTEYFGSREIHLYNDIIINRMLDDNADSDDLLQYVEEYMLEYPQEEMINWRNIARVYQNAGRTEDALFMLRRHAEYHDVSKDPGYYAVLSELHEMNGNYLEALHASNMYSDINDAIDIELHKSDIRLIEDRYMHHIDLLQQKHRGTIIITFLVLTCLLLGYWIVKWRKRLVMTKRDLCELQYEYDMLQSLKEKLDKQQLETSEKLSRLGDAYHYLYEQTGLTEDTGREVLSILGHRIKSLSAFLQKPIPDSLSKVAAQIDQLKGNRNYIVDSIGILYAVNYPDFISELRKSGLTSSEIGYCCLLLLGLNIPEAGKVIGRESSIYNVSSSIRKKINLSTCSSNLDKWLVRKFAEIYPIERR